MMTMNPESLLPIPLDNSGSSDSLRLPSAICSPSIRRGASKSNNRVTFIYKKEKKKKREKYLSFAASREAYRLKLMVKFGFVSVKEINAVKNLVGTYPNTPFFKSMNYVYSQASQKLKNAVKDRVRINRIRS